MIFLGKFSKKLLISLPILALVFSCAQRPAKVYDRSSKVYTKAVGLKNNRNYSRSSRATSRKKYGNEIEIVSGDTLYGISKKYNASVRDLIKENDLSPPYFLREGSRLKIPEARYYVVKEGDTLYGISRKFNMKINEIIKINDLEAPYNIRADQKIKISKTPVRFASNSSSGPSYKFRNKKDSSKSNPGFIKKTLDRFNHFSWPIHGDVVSTFGPKSGGLYNDGIKIKAAEGSEVKASESGVVAYVGNELKGYGNLVIVKHSGGWITAYAHLKSSSVKRGQKVKKGEGIGRVGATGNVQYPQLYFGLRKGRDAVNPQNYLKS